MDKLKMVLASYLSNPSESNNLEAQSLLLVNPVAGWVMVQTVASVIGASASAVSAFNSYRQLNEIVSKLNTVIALQRQILDEIRALKVYFNEVLYNAFLNDVAKDLQAQSLRYEVILAGMAESISAEDRQRLNILLNDVEQTSFKLLSYGPASYQSLGISMILLKSLYMVLDINVESQKLAFQKFDNQMYLWLVDKEIGLCNLGSKTKDEIDKLSIEFVRSCEPKEVYSGSPSLKTFIRVRGDLNTDLQLQLKYVGERRSEEWKDIPNEDRYNIFLTAQDVKRKLLNSNELLPKVNDMKSQLESIRLYSIEWSK